MKSPPPPPRKEKKGGGGLVQPLRTPLSYALVYHLQSFNNVILQSCVHFATHTIVPNVVAMIHVVNDNFANIKLYSGVVISGLRLACKWFVNKFIFSKTSGGYFITST